ncbi:MAG: transposase [Candidatus Parcubacteria bacterium]|nr:transposase [Candidatus Parcubacteria bacterium]
MLHKGAQKRIFFDGATYFVISVANNLVEYFKEPIFCELFIEELRLVKKMKNLDLFAFVILLDHFHLMFFPNESRDLSKIMQFLKRHFTRNINFILGYTALDEEAIGQSLLRLGDIYKGLQNEIEAFTLRKIELRQQFITKYELNQTQFSKFHWQKSYRDHYIRNQRDFDEHIRYISENPMKHQIPDAINYKYIFTNYPELISDY